MTRNSQFTLTPAIANQVDVASHIRYPLLFDPQTAGGMLATVPAQHAEACIAELKAAGYQTSCQVSQTAFPGDLVSDNSSHVQIGKTIERLPSAAAPEQIVFVQDAAHPFTEGGDVVQ